MTFSSIADQLKGGIVSPQLIQTYRNFLAGWMYSLNAEYGRIEAEAAQWITDNENNHKSHAACERAWQAGERGKKQLELKYQIRGIEHLQDALTSNHFLLSREWRESKSDER